MAKKIDPNKGNMKVSEAGRRGGERTREKHGPEFYEEIGRKGGLKVKRMIEEAKKLEKEE